MNFKEVIVHAVITNADSSQEKTFVNVVILAGGFHIGSVLKELKSNHPNSIRIEITDVEWVVEKTDLN